MSNLGEILSEHGITEGTRWHRSVYAFQVMDFPDAPQWRIRVVLTFQDGTTMTAIAAITSKPEGPDSIREEVGYLTAKLLGGYQARMKGGKG